MSWRRWRARTGLAAAWLTLACGGESQSLPPTGQVVLYVTTNAPLPLGPGELPLPNDPPALFDRLRVDVFAPGESEPCADCSREFELDRVRVANGEASIGVVPPPGVSGYVARARLYRAVTVKDGEPPQLSTIDVRAELPKVGREGIIERTLVLRVEDLGRHVEATQDTLEGAPDFAPVGTWPGAARVPCPRRPEPGEACVPGGAFWLGHPHVGFDEAGEDASETRLVVLSPFYVDLHEVTVAQFRAASLATLEGDSSVDPAIGPVEIPTIDDPLTPASSQFFCDYSDAPFGPEHSRENLALNCVSWSAASAYCKARGKALPSEAELEYLAGGLRSSLFLWGDGQDAVECGDAVWGAGGVGFFSASSGDCRPATSFGGPKPPGQGRLDRLPLEGGEVLDLMGNLSEWTRDYWNRSSEPCWADRTLLENPECQVPSELDGDRRVVKGFAWASRPTPAAVRFGREPDMPSARPQTGFRCVRAAE